MKRLLYFFAALTICTGLSACSTMPEQTEIVATTLPVYEFATRICQGTDIQVSRLITENVSCLHDYTLQTGQMRAIENAQIVITSGAGLEDFLGDVLNHADSAIDASVGVELNCHNESAEHNDHHGHDHDQDPHVWLSPANAMIMAQNICERLSESYPQHKAVFADNLAMLTADLMTLEIYADEQLNSLSNRNIITFHDGFSYMADAFDLTILHAIEEESGSEASATELAELITTVSKHNIQSIFTEKNGSDAAAKIVAAETGAKIYELDMAISGNSYFDAMYHNIDTLKEALK